MHRSLSMISLLLLLLIGCIAQPEEAQQSLRGSCALSVPPDASDEAIIEMVLMAEGSLVVEQNIGALMNLWSAGAEVVNAKNTPDDSSDDQSWLDKDAIRNRYVRIVFPGAPTQVTPKDLHIEITDSGAVVTATTQIGTEVSPAGDRWVLVKRDNCWEIQSLTYNLETN